MNKNKNWLGRWGARKLVGKICAKALREASVPSQGSCKQAGLAKTEMERKRWQEIILER